MPRQARRDTFGQMGRSMVEMLGVLAIMGIVGMVGVKMYTTAMNKHRANELIYEAQKRATMVAMQITAGQENLSITNFTNPTGYVFGVEKNPNNANQFNITITGVDSKVCNQMKTAVGSGTPVRLISEFCDKLTFNNDLSTMAYPSDYKTKTACQSNSYKWCTKGDNGTGTKCVLDGSDCCTDVSYNAQCQSCDMATGAVSNTAKEGNSCVRTFADNTTPPGICKSGICVDPNVTDGATCTSNADCGGTGSGYYCLITYKAANNLNSSLNGSENMTEQACYHDLTGTCTPVTGRTRLTISQQALLMQAGFPTTFVKGPSMNWWSANNWCQAQEKQLINVEDMNCYRGGTALVKGGETGSIYCCKSGQTCKAWGQFWNGKEIVDGKAEEIAKYSDKMVALKRTLGEYFWTASPIGANASQNSCYVFRVAIAAGTVYHCTRSSGYPNALCQ